MRREIRRQRTRIDQHFRIFRSLVRIADPGEFLDDSRACLRVEPLTVSLLADFERCGDEDLDEGAEFLDHLAHTSAGHRVWRDRSADRDTAVARDLRGDVADAQDVEVAMLAREPELAGEMLSDEIAV